eukprot:evm.model.scf_808.6 EVM.evm.TU.scf_808.6   scf_808:25755-30501(-)
MSAGGPPLTGGAAILARLRAQRAASSKKTSAQKPAVREAVIAFASQTGTAQDIACAIASESKSHGIASKVLSLNELGFENVSAAKTSVIVLVASSTGDGDPPDNASAFFRQLQKAQSPEQLKGIQFTCLGLGDSNYTSFMHVPRTLCRKFRELGAECFHGCQEADEVEGLEEIAEDWVERLWAPLKNAVAGGTVHKVSPEQEKTDGKVSTQQAFSQATSASNAGVSLGPQSTDSLASISDLCISSDVDLQGVPACPECRVKLVWEEDSNAADVVLLREKSWPSQQEMEHRDPKGLYNAENPFLGKVLEVRRLTAGWSDKRVLHVEVDLTGSAIVYRPGDSMGVAPANDPCLVNDILGALGIDGARVFSVVPRQESSNQVLLPHLHWPCSVQHALASACDITSVPRKTLLRLLAEHCSDEIEKRKLLYLCSRSGRDAYRKVVVEGNSSVVQILRSCPSCKPPLDALLDILPPLAPRLYSISSSQLEKGDKAQFAFTVVTLQTPWGTKNGVATHWMDRLLSPALSAASNSGKPQAVLPVFLRSGGAFHVPDTLEKPWIMIGPGTGVTPFLGFLQERRARRQAGGEQSAPCWLFFGCRQPTEDFLYEDELKDFLEEKTLNRLEVAFSRHGSSKVYVQHRIKEFADEVFDMAITQAGYVFVCGDGASMAKDVHDCLLAILQSAGRLTGQEAVTKLAEMSKERRYVRDIWS